MPRKTDSSNPTDWIEFAESDMEGLHMLASRQISYCLCASKLAEVLEKIIKAELIYLGWTLIKTHDLQILGEELNKNNSGIYADAQPLCAALSEKYFVDRYPGFDLDDEDWPALQTLVTQVEALLQNVKAHV